MTGRSLGWLGLSALFSGCVTATPVAAPSGSEGLLISCSNTADCYDKAREVCGGPYRIVDSGTKLTPGLFPQHSSSTVRTTNGGWATVQQTTPTTESKHEIMVECGAAASPATAANAAPKKADEAKVEAEAGLAPTSAAGFNFGDTVEATNAQCTNAGHEWKGSGSKYKCTGTAVDTGLDAQARFAFCKATLCRIDVVSPPPTDAAAIATRLEKVLKLLTERYGNPTKREVTYPQSCAAAALPRCLEEDKARFLYQWSFKGRKSIVLSLGPKKIREAYEDPPKRTEADVTALKSIRVRYDEGRTPDPAKNAAAAEASPESEREVGGL